MNDFQDIINRAKSGDNEAFGLIYKEFYKPIYRYIYVRVRDEDIALDLTGEVFLKIYRNVQSLTAIENFESYFYTVAKHTLIDSWRKKTVTAISDEEGLSEVPDEGPTAMVTAQLKEQSDILYECLDKLTPDQQEIITLKFINELSTKEIAEITGKAETAIRQLQVRALKSLSKMFKKRYESKESQKVKND